MEKEIIEIENGDVVGYQIELGNIPLVIVKVRKGYVMSGYLNIDVANRLGDIAGKVKDVNTYYDALKATVVELTNEAKKKGLKVGMSGRDFLNKLLES